MISVNTRPLVMFRHPIIRESNETRRMLSHPVYPESKQDVSSLTYPPLSPLLDQNRAVRGLREFR